MRRKKRKRSDDKIQVAAVCSFYHHNAERPTFRKILINIYKTDKLFEKDYFNTMRFDLSCNRNKN